MGKKAKKHAKKAAAHKKAAKKHAKKAHMPPAKKAKAPAWLEHLAVTKPKLSEPTVDVDGMIGDAVDRAVRLEDPFQKSHAKSSIAENAVKAAFAPSHKVPIAQQHVYDVDHQPVVDEAVDEAMEEIGLVQEEASA